MPPSTAKNTAYSFNPHQNEQILPTLKPRHLHFAENPSTVTGPCPPFHLLLLSWEKL